MRFSPTGQPRGPDARLLADPGAVHAAAGRLAALTTLAATSATTLLTPPPGSPSGAWYLDAPEPFPPPSIRILRRIAGLAQPAAEITALHSGPDQHGALDPLGPLLGEAETPPLERQLGWLRHAAHSLSQPDYRPSHELLLAFADFARAVAALSPLAASRAERTASRQKSLPFDQLRTAAAATERAWSYIPATLQNVHSLGSDGTTAIRAMERIRRRLHTAITTPDIPTGHTADVLALMRHAALTLPDLSIASATILHQLAGRDLLTLRARRLHHTELPRTRVDSLLRHYEHALSASTTLISELGAVPGQPPQPALPSYLTTTATPSLPLPDTARPAPPRPWTPPSRWTEIRDRDHGVIRCETWQFTVALRHPP